MLPTHSRTVARAKARAKRLMYQPQRLPWYSSMLIKLRLWVNQEIVCDDPWDVDSLFTESAKPTKSPSQPQPD